MKATAGGACKSNGNDAWKLADILQVEAVFVLHPNADADVINKPVSL